MANPVGHPIPHLDDPGACLIVIIDSTQELPARICAGCDLAHFAARTFLPHTEKSAVTGDLKSKSDAELCAMIQAVMPESAGAGMASIDWSKVWAIVKPIVLELISRWLMG